MQGARAFGTRHGSGVAISVRAIVTGGHGFVGRHLVAHLRTR